MTTSIGAGIGGFAAVVAQPTYGASFVTPTRALPVKSAKMTPNPHPLQGGPYLRDGTAVDIGSARILTWLDAMGTLTGDMLNTGAALLLATALGSTATLTQLSSTTAYELGGASGAVLGYPDVNNGGSSGTCVDMQLGAPDAGGTLHAFNYHSCVITKAEWVFDRTGIVTYSYDVDSQYVETSTSLISPSEAAAPVPFSMAGSSCAFKVGAYGSEAQVDGIRKATFTLERKLKTDRIYLGNAYKDLPVTNDNVKLTCSLEVDYTSAAKPAIFDLMLAGTPISVICLSVGNAIGSSGHSDTFQLQLSNAFVDTGGVPPLDGPDVLKNTIAMSGTVDSTPHASLSAVLITADTTF
jgi:hypothetical protein